MSFERAFKNYLISRFGLNYLDVSTKHQLKVLRNAFKAGWKAGIKEK